MKNKLHRLHENNIFNSMLFGIITGNSIDKMQAIVNQLPEHIRHVELRLDTLTELDSLKLAKWISSRRDLQWLFTLRPKRQGGYFQGDEHTRLKLLHHLCTLLPDYVDLEYDIPLSIWAQFATDFPVIRWICSYHHFTETPPDLNALLESLQHPYAHFYKIAVTARSSLDALRLMHFKFTSQLPWTGIAMGADGFCSRLFSPIIGNPFNYASPTPLPSIPLIEELEDPYRYSQLNAATTVYALIGTPLNKSIGHHVHNAFFQAHKINAVYIKITVTAQELPAFIALARDLPFRGFSVTMPLKEAILPYLDAIDPIAEQIGAVNTIDIREGRWIGYNTDGLGALNALEKIQPVHAQHLVIVGAGGAAKAIAYEALQRGARVTLLNRNAAKARQLALRLGCQGEGLDQLSQVARDGYDILVNTTPDGSWIPKEFLRSEALIMDINMSSLMSAIDGLAMWKEQASVQQHIWFNTPH